MHPSCRARASIDQVANTYLGKLYPLNLFNSDIPLAASLIGAYPYFLFFIFLL